MQNYIFTITTGRSGTKYLASLFKTVKNTISLHEPSNEASYLREINKNHNTEHARKFVEDSKIKSIALKMKNTENCTYIETSHVICKGFLEHLIKHYPDLKIVYLSRDLKSVAKSLYKHQSITQRHIRDEKARSYYLFPTDKICRFKLTQAQIEQLTDFELCVWYYFEIFSIYQEFRRKGRPIYQISLDDLNSFDKTVEFFNRLGLHEYDEKALRGQLENPLNVGKDDSHLDLTDEQMNQSIYKITNLYLKNYDYIC